jgi:uncharacterized protein (DUF1501 family)
MTLHRRKFLSYGAALGAGLFGVAGLPGLALAALPTDKRLAVVILRGGLDGLAAVPPYADPAYAELRDRLALPDPSKEGGVIGLSNFFGLHPSLSALKPLYDAQQLAVFHAVATPYRERSHFDGQNCLETGTGLPNSLHDGWLNRMLALYGGGRPMGLAIGNTIPMLLYGDSPVTSWTPAGGTPEEPVLEQLAKVYAHDPAFQMALGEAMHTQQLAETADLDSMQAQRRGGGRGNNADLAPLAAAAAGFLTTAGGPRVAVMEMGGWDTHANQGTTQGTLANRLQALGDGIARFKEKLGAAWSSTAVVVMTEFGRTVAMNGTQGTDHGTAGMALLTGGAVRGGRVLANWPGLSRDKLYQSRDLAPTLDLRSIVKGVLRDHMGVPEQELAARVFPNSAAIRPLDGLIAT